MKEMDFNYSASLISKTEIIQLEKEIQNEIKKMILASNKGYNDDRASINLPNDMENLEKVKTLINKKQKLNPKYIILIGIGGSNLGTIAIQEAVLGKLYNLKNPPLKILYADTVDTDTVYDINSIIENTLKKGENIIINIVEIIQLSWW